MVAHLDDGTQAEVGLVGFEGMNGLPLVVGVDTAFTDTYMQASGTGLQMEAAAFQRELEDNPALLRDPGPAWGAEDVTLRPKRGYHGRWPLTVEARWPAGSDTKER